MNNENRPASKTPYVVGAVLGVAVIGGAIAWAFGSDKAADTDAAPETTSSTTEGNAPAQVPAAPAGGAVTGTAYKDGTYNASGSYVSPAGAESITVGLTIKGGEVVDATFAGNANNPTSKQYQAKFAAGYKQYVVGKKVDDIALGVVNGSSLVPRGFADALAKIKAEANG